MFVRTDLSLSQAKSFQPPHARADLRFAKGTLQPFSIPAFPNSPIRVNGIEFDNLTRGPRQCINMWHVRGRAGNGSFGIILRKKTPTAGLNLQIQNHRFRLVVTDVDSYRELKLHSTRISRFYYTHPWSMEIIVREKRPPPTMTCEKVSRVFVPTVTPGGSPYAH